MRNIMRLAESQTVQFHPELNPKLWQHETLKPIVRLKLFQNALEFYKFLDVDHLIVNDIIITGSNAAYNYTALSDIDVHLIVDFDKTTCPALVGNLFLTKKALWSDTYAVKIYGYPVELYVENAADPVKASGIYSILHNTWVKKPSSKRPHEDDHAVKVKLHGYIDAISDLLDGNPTIKAIDGMLARLKKFRQSGLQAGGEFGVENIVYKLLRDEGYLDRLFDKRIALRDQELSI
jgi:hypothetical protein